MADVGTKKLTCCFCHKWIKIWVFCCEEPLKSTTLTWNLKHLSFPTAEMEKDQNDNWNVCLLVHNENLLGWPQTQVMIWAKLSNSIKKSSSHTLANPNWGLTDLLNHIHQKLCHQFFFCNVSCFHPWKMAHWTWSLACAATWYLLPDPLSPHSRLWHTGKNSAGRERSAPQVETCNMTCSKTHQNWCHVPQIRKV